MNFGEAIKTCFSKYATFSGRAPRPEYWYWVLFYVLAASGCVAVGAMLAVIFGDRPEFIIALISIFVLLTIIPYIAVSVRRLHDMDHSGWWFLIVLIPNIGGLILFIWFMFRGTEGVNRFDADPLDGSDDPKMRKSSIPSVSRDD